MPRFGIVEGRGRGEKVVTPLISWKRRRTKNARRIGLFGLKLTNAIFVLTNDLPWQLFAIGSVCVAVVGRSGMCGFAPRYVVFQGWQGEFRSGLLSSATGNTTGNLRPRLIGARAFRSVESPNGLLGAVVVVGVGMREVRRRASGAGFQTHHWPADALDPATSRNFSKRRNFLIATSRFRALDLDRCGSV